jgi:hypothetical protein
MKKQWFQFELGLLCVLFYLSGCAVSPENPGQCALNCSKSVILGSDPTFQIKLISAVPKFTCATGLTQEVDFNGPVMAQFVVLDRDAAPAGGDMVGAGTGYNGTPVPNISINPLVLGIVSIPRTHPENVQIYQAGQTLPDGTVATGQTYYPYRYLGISTPKSNWCSDSCGVVTMEFVPVCPVAGATNNVSMQVSSGSVTSEVANFEIYTPEANEDRE